MNPQPVKPLGDSTGSRAIFMQMLEAAPVATAYYQPRAPLRERIAKGIIAGTLFAAMLMAVVAIIALIGEHGLP